jgi:hypothetical protein
LFSFTVLAPVLMDALERKKTLARAAWAAGPIQMALCGVCLTFATPLCCALFAQKVPMPVDELEEEVREQVLAKNPLIKTVYYNKGL